MINILAKIAMNQRSIETFEDVVFWWFYTKAMLQGLIYNFRAYRILNIFGISLVENLKDLQGTTGNMNIKYKTGQ